MVRIKRTRSGLSVRAISGTYVVLLGINLRESDCPGLRGFAIHRTDHTEGESYYLKGLKTFAETDPGFPPGASYSTRDHPIQGFGWSDYTAKPGHLYTYRVEALTGPPANLTVSKKVEVTVATEAPVGGDHDIYFNRGVAASQAYATRFGNRKPKEVGQSAYDWLSRGLYEAILEFIAAATGPGHGLRVAAYEFHHPGVLEALRDARDRGVDVRIVYDARKDQPKAKNDAAVALVGLGPPVSTAPDHPSVHLTQQVHRPTGERCARGGADRWHQLLRGRDLRALQRGPRRGRPGGRCRVPPLLEPAWSRIPPIGC